MVAKPATDGATRRLPTSRWISPARRTRTHVERAHTLDGGACTQLVFQYMNRQEHHGELTPHAAAVEVRRTSRRVRRRARWPGWLWAILGVVIFGFTLATSSGSQLATDIAGPIPLIVGVGGFVFASRQGIVGQGRFGQADKMLSYVFLGAVVVGTVIELTVLPHRLTGWLVLLAALMVVPCWIGTWRWLRS